MIKVLKQFLKNHITVFILFFVSLLLIVRYIKSGFSIGSGEVPYLIDPTNARFFYLWNDKSNFGSFSSLQSAIVFYFFMWKILGIVSAWIHESVLFVFLSFFLPGLFFYIFLNSIFKYKNRLIYLPPSLLYTFNIFRISASYSNTNLNLLFIFLPLFLLFYMKLLYTKNILYLFGIVVLSVLSSSMGGNLAVESTLPLIMGLYLVYYVLIERKAGILWLLATNLLLAISLLAVNMFWLFPIGISLRSEYSEIGGSVWSALNAGTFVDHLRFMGFWAFRTGYGGRDYFPFFRLYYTLPILLSTFLTSLIVFSHIFVKSNRSANNKKLKYFRGFVIFAIVVSLTLVIGTKGPFGFGYNFLYNNIFAFKIYREPYAKFMPLFVLASALSMTFSLRVILNIFKSSIKQSAAIFFIALLVLVNVFPLFTGQSLHVKRWIQGSAGSVAVIPDYWKEATGDFDKINSDEKIALTPHNSYVSKYNWEYGTNVVGNIADYISSKNFVNSWNGGYLGSAEIVRNIFDKNFIDTDLNKLLGLLNVRYVLQENDVEWRYTSDVYAPSLVNQSLLDKQLKPVKSYGVFDTPHLDALLNEDIDADSRNELYYELSGEPILVLYEANKKYFLPHFYIPKNNIVAIAPIENLAKVVGLAKVDEVRTNYYISNGIESGNEVDNIILSESQDVLVFGKRLDPPPFDINERVWSNDWELVYSEIDPTSLLGKLNRYSDRLGVFLERDNFEKIDKLMQLTTNKVSQVRGFEISASEKEELILEVLELNLEAISLLKDIQVIERERADSYWKKANKLSLFFERNIIELEEEQIPNELLEPFYYSFFDYLGWMEGSGYLKRPENSFSFNVPRAGEYELLSKEGDVWEKKKDVTLSEPQKLALDLSDDLNIEKELIMQESVDKNFPTALIEIPEWAPFKTYKISFDFIVRRRDINVSVLEDAPDYGFFGSHVENEFWYEAKKSQVPLERKKIFKQRFSFSRLCLGENEVRSDENCYSHFETFVSSTPKSSSGYLFIEFPVESSELAFGDIKNIRISEFSEPEVVLKGREEFVEKESHEIPKISFRKISPTKYFVKVRGAVDPYTLAFIENFNSGWKLRLMNEKDRSNGFIGELYKGLLNLMGVNNLSSVEGNSKDVYSYFDGDIEEGPHSFEFFESNVIGALTQKKISENKHFIANGFANAWYITPNDVDGAENYELVVEFLPQKYFYLGLMFSGLVFGVSIAGIVFFYIKRGMRGSKITHS